MKIYVKKYKKDQKEDAWKKKIKTNKFKSLKKSKKIRKIY
jgi:hypothetical protein